MKRTYVKSETQIGCLIETEEKAHLITISDDNLVAVAQVINTEAITTLKSYDKAKEQDFNTKLSFAKDTNQKGKAFTILNSQFQHNT